VVAAVYRGVDPSNAIDGLSSNGTTATTTAITAPSVTTTAANDRLVLFEGVDGESVPVSWQAPAGMTDRVHTLYVPETVAAIADQTVATPGPTGPRTATLAPNTGSDSILTA